MLLDIWMPDTDGISLLKEWASSGQLTMPTIMMSGHATIDTAVEATRIGAYDFLEKPISMPRLLAAVGRALAAGAVQSRPALTLAQFGRSAVIQDLAQRLARVAASNEPLLLTGEPGCGFELCARAVHRPNTPWAAPRGLEWLAENAFEPLAAARDGVLFLDNVSAIDRHSQRGLMQLVAKLDKFNVRLVTSSTQSLSALTQRGEFDANLFQALSTLMLRVPSLRDRAEDIPDIATLLLRQMVEAREVPVVEFSIAALNAMRNLAWHGNLPSLANAVKTLALTASGGEISAQDVNMIAAEFNDNPVKLSEQPDLRFDVPLRQARDAFEMSYFQHHIRQEGGNMSKVAERVGLERTHLYRKLKQLGIRPPGRGDESSLR